MGSSGGTWSAQNKLLPGTYINFVSASNATSILSNRGIATIPVITDWGIQDKILEITASDFQKNCLALFGYNYDAPQMKRLRDFFKNIQLGYIFRLGKDGVKASCAYAEAVCEGERGNALKVVIASNVDVPAKFDVMLYLENNLVDKQTVATANELVDNPFVKWVKTAVLAVTAGTSLTNGTNPAVTNSDYQRYLELIESYAFNVIGCPTDSSTIKGMFTAFTRRMREEQGVKFQCVVYNPISGSDYEGVIDVLNEVTDDDAEDYDAVWWVTGIAAGMNVNQSATNKVYTGEFTLDVNHTQINLENALKNGKFAFHRVGNTEIRVLADINSLVTVTSNKNDDFKQNQTIRVIDKIANDIAVLFYTKYMGEIPGDADGRTSLWSDIVKHHEELQTIRAIENFSGKDVVVAEGDTKRSVMVSDAITVVNMMEKLYMAVAIA